jgi:hypothetical protein
VIVADGLAIFPPEFDRRIKHPDVSKSQLSDFREGSAQIARYLGRVTTAGFRQVIPLNAFQIDKAQKE